MLPEIVDHILGFLHSDEDYTTLEICSAVFPQLVERHLYSRITLTILSGPFRTFNKIIGNILDVNQFSFILLSRPHIANYVRFVRIIMICGQALPVILSKFPQITSIALDGVNSSWDELDSRFRSDFQNTLCFPSINEVVISGIESFPLNILDCCGNLQHLQLFSHCTGGEAVSTSFYPRLSSLGIASQTDVAITRVVSWMSMKTNALHSLSLLVDGRDLSQFRTLIEACSPTLVNLELQGCVSDVDDILPVLRVQLPLLERIIIWFAIVVGFQNHHSSLPVLVPFLFSLPNTHPIRLCLHVEFRGQFPRNLDWSDVASLVVLPVFRHPIEFCVMSRYDSFADMVSSFIQDPVLKRLHEMGELVIKQSVCREFDPPVDHIDLSRPLSRDF